MPKASPPSSADSQEDVKPYPKSPTKTSPKKSPSKVKLEPDQAYLSKESPQKKGSSGGGGASCPWTPEETWRLFEAMYERKTNVNWEEVAAYVGRDKKSCSNRFDRNIKKNLQKQVGGC